VNELIEKRETFAVETTLSGLTLISKIQMAKEYGYNITLLFFWLQSINLAKARVKLRVQEGGHSVSDAVIEKRYIRGIDNLLNKFIPIVNNVMIFDNSELKPELIAEKEPCKDLLIINEAKFEKLKNYIL
jgi:predicted ABC-type ATPase